MTLNFEFIFSTSLNLREARIVEFNRWENQHGRGISFELNLPFFRFDFTAGTA